VGHDVVEPGDLVEFPRSPRTQLYLIERDFDFFFFP
jgi:hypothetical protein